VQFRLIQLMMNCPSGGSRVSFSLLRLLFVFFVVIVIRRIIPRTIAFIVEVGESLQRALLTFQDTTARRLPKTALISIKGADLAVHSDRPMLVFVMSAERHAGACDGMAAFALCTSDHGTQPEDTPSVLRRKIRPDIRTALAAFARCSLKRFAVQQAVISAWVVPELISCS
jgi:hypothetical protein